MPGPIQPDVVYRLPSVGDPSLSPDGSLLAYNYSWVDQEKMEPCSRIMMMRLSDGEAREFTQGKSDSAPKFSPDGGRLAFLRRDDGGRRGLWVMDVGGGEARALKTGASSVADFAWSPDGRRMVYCADVDPEQQPEGENGGGAPKVKVVNRIRYRFDGLGWRGDAHFHLFVTGLDGGEPAQLTDGDWDDVAPVWSPDGSRVAFISGRRADRDRLALTQVYVVSAEGGGAECWSEGLTDVGALAWSPGGRQIVTAGSDTPQGMSLWQSWLYVLEPGTTPRRLTDDNLRPLLNFPVVTRPPELRWTDDGRIIYLADQRGESWLVSVPASGGDAQWLAGGGRQSNSAAVDTGARTAVVLSSYPGSPGELYHVDLASGTERQLTSSSEPYLVEHPPALMEKFWVEREGWEIECRLWLPPGFDESQQYPLVLDIHGGPNGAFYDSFAPAQQVLAGAGYLVLTVNPRGSSTYGQDFMMAVLEDWGGEDYLDLIAAVEDVAERPYVDRDRLGVHGYSYGGYMSAWIIGQDNRFKAAVVGAPCIDLYSMYGTSDIGVSFGEDQWGGNPVDAAHKLLERSPIAYAAKVDTPALLLHGEDDLRCPVSQSEEYFSLLKRLGKEVEFVRFPGCNHIFPRMGHPKMREEYLARTLAWFQRWV